MSNPIKQFSELLSGPLGELIASIGRGVGEAQAALDEGSLRQTLALYKTESEQEIKDQDNIASDEEKGNIREERRLMQLIRSIGYQPTFYVIPETEVEAKVSLNLNTSNKNNNRSANKYQPYKIAKYSINATPLNANNINQYNLNANAAATLKFKIVPVPPPSGVSEKRIMPNLVDRKYDDETRELIISLGLSYSLDKKSEELLAKKPNAVLQIAKQNIEPNAIIDINTAIILSLKS